MGPRQMLRAVCTLAALPIGWADSLLTGKPLRPEVTWTGDEDHHAFILRLVMVVVMS